MISTTPKPADKLILALDGMNKKDILKLYDNLPDLIWVKVGLELFLKEGPEIIKTLKNKGLKIFLDLKFHDIPATVSAACKEAARNGVELITVHGCSGFDSLSQANIAALEGASQKGYQSPTLLAVTVLTSWTQDSFSDELFIDQKIEDRVLGLLHLAKRAGIGGCICSPLEADSIRKKFPEPFLLITPGIRSPHHLIGDQKRIMTPYEAINNGASKLVIGRPITLAEDPKFEFDQICRQIASVTI